MPPTTMLHEQTDSVPIDSVPTGSVSTNSTSSLGISVLRALLWLELPWVALLALPLTLPGQFLAIRYTPTLIFLLFLFWPIHVWLAWRHGYPWLGAFRIPIGGILVALVVSLAVASDLRFAWLMTAHLALGIALFAALIRWPPTRRWPGLVALGLIGVALILSVVGPPLIGATLPSARAATLFVTLLPIVKSWQEPLNPNILAGGLLLAIPLSFAWALAAWGSSWRTRLIGLVRIPLLLAITWWLCQVLPLTQSRGALLAAACSLVVALLLRWPKLTPIALVLVCVGGIWLFLNDPWYQLNLVMANGMARDYNSRMEIWVRSWLTFRQHWLTGIGIGGFVPLVVESMIPIRMSLSPQVTHAHNLLLQVAVDLGIVGLVAYLACMIMSGICAVRAWRIADVNFRALAGGVLAALVALNVHGVVDAPLWNSKLAFLPWVLFALGALLAQQTGGPVTTNLAHGMLERGQKEGQSIDERVA